MLKKLQVKKYLTLILLLFLGVNVNAQKITEDSLINMMAAETCNKIEDNSFSDLNASNFQMKLGMLFLTSFEKHHDELENIYGADYLTDKVQLRKIGEKMGFKLGISCKKFQEFMMNNTELLVDMAGNKKADKAKPKENETSIISGKLLSYTKSELSYFTIKLKNNSVQKVYWLNSFNGADLLLNNTKSYINKEVFFECKEISIFDGTKQLYKKIKIIDLFYEDERIEEIKEDIISTKTIKEN